MITFDNNRVIRPPFSVSNNRMDDYYNLFITALNESGFLSFVFGNKINDYHNLFTITLNKSGFTYDGSTVVVDDFEFSDTSFL